MNGIQVFLAAYAQPLIWLAVALVMLIIEAATVQMVSIWFCLGAVAAAIAAILGGSIPVQIIVFVVISGVTLAFTRKFVKKVLRVKKTPTNADSVIGAIGQVVEPIDDEAGTGRIKVEGMATAQTTYHVNGSAIHQADLPDAPTYPHMTFCGWYTTPDYQPGTEVTGASGASDAWAKMALDMSVIK